MVLSKLLDVVGVLDADFLEGGDAIAKSLSFGCLVALVLLLAILPALEELARWLTDSFLELWLLGQLPLGHGGSLTHPSGFPSARLLHGGAWVSGVLGQEVAAIVAASRGLDHGPEEDLLVALSVGVSWVTHRLAVRFRVLQALLEAVHLALQALHQRLLAAGLRSIVCLGR